MFQHHKNFDKIFRYSNFLWPFAPYLTWGVVNCGFVNFIWRKLLIYRRSWLRCVVFSCVSVLDILPAHLSGKFCQLSGHSTIFPSIRPSVRLFVRSLARSFVRLFVRSVCLSATCPWLTLQQMKKKEDVPMFDTWWGYALSGPWSFAVTKICSPLSYIFFYFFSFYKDSLSWNKKYTIILVHLGFSCTK